jgi:tetratricopeptide (TPR) repeat protein
LSTAAAESDNAADRLAERAKGLIKKADFAAADRLIREELHGVDLAISHAELLYMLAVAQRYQEKLDDALATLDQLLSLDPENARGWQEQGHTLLSQNHLDRARLAYENAVRLNPALLASWKALINLCEIAGLPKQAQTALEQEEFLSELPKELLSVTSMIHEGKLYKAERLCRHFLQNNKHHIEGMRLLAAIGDRLEVLSDAEFLLESCVEFAPEHDAARYDYANLLLKMQKFEKAHEQTRILVDKEPGNLAYRSLFGNATAGIGEHQKAIELYNEVLNESPGQIMLYVMRGHAQKTIGELDAAIDSYHKAYELKPDYGDAFWSLANTKTYSFTDAEIAHMEKHEATESISTEDRIHMCFALGKAFEDRGEYEPSFRYYSRGNAQKQESVRHKPAHLAIRTSAQIEVCTAEFFEQKQAVGFAAPDPIFIVGLPRAGSTLLEQILASHSMVEGTHELPNIIALAQRLRGSPNLIEEKGGTPNYPKILTELDDDYFRRFGEQFIEDTRIYRQEASFFIDKNPNNFFHIGLIKLILPNAKVIDARRHPMSCCFSGFKQLFGQGQEFSYGLEQIGNYYREYVELMDHWDDALPGFVLRVQHEDVVDDLETQVRRMLDFCKLPFELACLDYHKTDRSVRTPSSEQVRQPIYRSGLDHWRNYEPWLGPLKEALGVDVRRQFDIDP